MKESLLHFIWQYLHFNVKNLSTYSGSELTIIKQGNYQHNSGPDFENCQIMIDNIRLVGNIEIHVNSSDWNKHKHQHDPAYDTVILHVVWNHDQDVLNSKGNEIPVLELNGRVPQSLFSRYERLISNRNDILCHDEIEQLPRIRKLELIDKAVSLRLEQKSNIILGRLAENKNDWEETAYQTLLQYFGFNVNNEAFLRLAQTLPYKLIKKHVDQPMQVEALLFGVAGFLHDESDQYAVELRQEYEFLATKYQIIGREIPKQQWKFLRLRPANFPTVRIAQLASILSAVSNLFSFLINEKSTAVKVDAFRKSVSAYWQKHYDFGKEYKKAGSYMMGRKSIENLFVNTVAPLLAAYAVYLNQESYMRQALELLEDIKPEQNKITRLWEDNGFRLSSALDSQGLIMQYNHFCLEKRCLECVAGTFIIRN
ncbi:MAG: DUF2851 family protein [Bacteroidota bacterium]